MIKGIKINVVTQSVEVITLRENNLDDIYNVIGNGCDTFSVPFTFHNNDAVYVDDEALLKPYFGGFLIEGMLYPIIGNGVILGTNSEGASVDAQSTIDDLTGKIKFVTYEDIQNTDWD